MNEMKTSGFKIDQKINLNAQFLIAGFEGWGNALDVSTGLIDYLIKKFNARPFAEVITDFYYDYDTTRPLVAIEKGILTAYTPPKGQLYITQTNPDRPAMILLKAQEPNFNWNSFAQEMFQLCSDNQIKTIFTIGGLLDSVLPDEYFISFVASNPSHRALLKKKKIEPMTYNGPGAIHSIFQAEGEKKGFDCLSLWGHCPYYIQNITHHGMIAQICQYIAQIIGIEIDTSDLYVEWEEALNQIQLQIDQNSKFKNLVEKISHPKPDQPAHPMPDTNAKILNLKDFRRPDTDDELP